MRNEKWEIYDSSGKIFIFHSQGNNKSRCILCSGLYYLAFGNASSDNSLKKSCCKITLILINKRASRLFRLKMLYTFVRSQGICVANHAADLPCFLKISSMCLPIFIRVQSWFSPVMLLSAAKVWNKSQYISRLLWKCFLIPYLFFYSTCHRLTIGSIHTLLMIRNKALHRAL